MLDWTAEFPGLRAGTYLNSCAHGLLPRRTRAAIDAHLDRWTSDPDWGAWGDAQESARAAFARLVGAQPGETALQANATSGVAAVLHALPEGPRREIVTMSADFPTSPFLAQRLQRRGFRHEHVRVDGVTSVEEWARHLGPQTAIAILPAVASFNGWRLPIKEMIAAAHAKGVPVLVDAFQAAGTFPIDVKAWDADFLVTGVYKWLLSPAGLAFLYAAPNHHALQPTTSGWQAAAAPYGFDPMGPLAADARRFQQGGPSVVGCVAYEASARLLEEVGVRAIESRNRQLTQRLRDAAAERKWDVLTPEQDARSSIVTFRVPDLERVLAACQREGVVVNPRLGGIRVSPHFYNRDADVDRLFAVLDAA